MNKLKLRLDELAVESFDTTRLSDDKGTVFGEQCSCQTVCSCPGCPTCDATCAQTCDDPTCVGQTCWGNTCEGTCALDGCPLPTRFCPPY
jgi:hypothetical protein